MPPLPAGKDGMAFVILSDVCISRASSISKHASFSARRCTSYTVLPQYGCCSPLRLLRGLLAGNEAQVRTIPCGSSCYCMK